MKSPWFLTMNAVYTVPMCGFYFYFWEWAGIIAFPYSPHLCWCFSHPSFLNWYPSFQSFRNVHVNFGPAGASAPSVELTWDLRSPCVFLEGKYSISVSSDSATPARITGLARSVRHCPQPFCIFHLSHLVFAGADNVLKCPHLVLTKPQPQKLSSKIVPSWALTNSKLC